MHRENKFVKIEVEVGRFSVDPAGERDFAEGHAVLEQGYVPRVIRVCLDLVLLAESRLRHTGGLQAGRKELCI